MIKRALISVSDKTGIVKFAKELEKLGIEIISTGGTAKTLSDNGINVTKVSDVTDFPEILDGRVKTLNPKIHGGILAVRENKEHIEELKQHNIETIDLVVINLYPFEETINKIDVSLEEAIENIDIGGPTMIRAAGKNFKDVVVVIKPDNYDGIIKELSKNGEISYNTRLKLAQEVFEYMAYYDGLIANYLKSQMEITQFPEKLTINLEKVQDLRYGENPHQKAAFYRETVQVPGSLAYAEQLHGKALSFNNINDTNAAIEMVRDFKKPTIVGVKHANPCGIGSSDTIYHAYRKAFEADPISIFGGIIASNRIIDIPTAEDINSIFIEVVVAPDYDKEALEILRQKKNIRLLKIHELSIPSKSEGMLDMKRVKGGFVIQEVDKGKINPEDLTVVTNRKPTAKEMEDLLFGWTVVKHVKSNAIVLAQDEQTVGIGPGQTNRIWAAQNAIRQAGDKAKGSVLASDAFFPFPDVVEAAEKSGITAIIQPGGSIRDEESIKVADKANIAMVFTGMRHFKH